MEPPFSITSIILASVSQIERVEVARPEPHLRKSNRVRTVQGSLAIERNTLGLDQVTALLKGQRVVGEKKEIREVLNAIHVYEEMASFDAHRSRF